MSAALAACGADDVPPGEDDAAIRLDFGADAGTDPAAGCVVVCQYAGPGEYRAECRTSGGIQRCAVEAYPICDATQLPPEFDGGVYPAPVCARLDATEVRITACAADARGAPLLTEAPVVRCIAAE